MTDDTTDTTRLLERLAATFPDQPAPLPTLVEAAHAGRRRRTRRTIALVAASSVLALGGGITLLQVLPDDAARRSDRVADTPEACDRDAPRSPSPVPQGPDYPTNASGLTYGAHSDEKMPDLIAAMGVCGRTGYLRAMDLEDPAPWVPGAGGTDGRMLPLYESDGVTQIDTFEEGRGGEPLADPPAPTGPDAADVQGEWNALIAGISSSGTDRYDTFRDLDLSITFDGNDVTVFDGCRSWSSGFSLEDGELALSGPFSAASDVSCKRAAPLPQVLDNIRHVTEPGKQVYLHLENFQIAVVLTRP